MANKQTQANTDHLVLSKITNLVQIIHVSAKELKEDEFTLSVRNALDVANELDNSESIPLVSRQQLANKIGEFVRNAKTVFANGTSNKSDRLTFKTHQDLTYKQQILVANLLETSFIKSITSNEQKGLVYDLLSNETNTELVNNIRVSLNENKISNAYALNLIDDISKIIHFKANTANKLSGLNDEVFITTEYVKSFRELTFLLENLKGHALSSIPVLINPLALIITVLTLMIFSALTVVELMKFLRNKYLNLSAEGGKVIEENKILIEGLKKNKKPSNLTGTTLEISKYIYELSSSYQSSEEDLTEQKIHSDVGKKIRLEVGELVTNMEKLVTTLNENKGTEIPSPLKAHDGLTKEMQQLNVSEIELMQGFEKSTNTLVNSTNKMKQALSTIHIRIGSINTEGIDISLEELQEQIKAISETSDSLATLRLELNSIYKKINEIIDKIENSNTQFDERNQTIERTITSLKLKRIETVERTIFALREIVGSDEK